MNKTTKKLMYKSGATLAVVAAVGLGASGAASACADNGQDVYTYKANHTTVQGYDNQSSDSWKSSDDHNNKSDWNNNGWSNSDESNGDDNWNNSGNENSSNAWNNSGEWNGSGDENHASMNHGDSNDWNNSDDSNKSDEWSSSDSSNDSENWNDSEDGSDNWTASDESNHGSGWNRGDDTGDDNNKSDDWKSSDDWSDNQKHDHQAQMASWSDSSSHNDESSMSGDMQDEMYVKMDAALREHAPVTVDALRAQFMNAPDQEAVWNQVEQNNMMVTDLVGMAYPGTSDEFSTMWRGHIDYYKQYLMATASNDETGKEQAKQGLVDGSYEMSNLLADASDGNLDGDELQSELAMHGDQVMGIIDNLAGGNYDAAWQMSHEAYEHMGMIAETLAYGSVTAHEYDHSEV